MCAEISVKNNSFYILIPTLPTLLSNNLSTSNHSVVSPSLKNIAAIFFFTYVSTCYTIIAWFLRRHGELPYLLVSPKDIILKSFEIWKYVNVAELLSPQLIGCQNRLQFCAKQQDETTRLTSRVWTLVFNSLHAIR